MSTLPENFRKLFFRLSPVKAFREYFNRCVNKFRAWKRLKLHKKCATFAVGKGECNYLDISVKSKNLDYESKKLDFTGASKSVIDRKTILVGYSFFDTFD